MREGSSGCCGLFSRKLPPVSPHHCARYWRRWRGTHRSHKETKLEVKRSTLFIKNASPNVKLLTAFKPIYIQCTAVVYDNGYCPNHIFILFFFHLLQLTQKTRTVPQVKRSRRTRERERRKMLRRRTKRTTKSQMLQQTPPLLPPPPSPTPATGVRRALPTSVACGPT